MINDKLITALLFIASTINGFAQQSISIDDFLKNKIEQNSTPTMMIVRDFNPSWIDQVDFRTETDEFDVVRQRYSVRVSPSSPKIRKAQRNLHQLYQEKANLESNIPNVDFIEFAYEELLTIIELSRKIRIKQNLLIVLNDQEIVHTRLLQIAKTTPKDWLEVQQDITQLKIDIYQHQEELNSLLPNGKSIEIDHLIPINQLLKQLKPEANLSSKEQEVAIDLQLLEGEVGLEKAEQKNAFDFLQVEYRGPQKNPFEEKVSITAGFQFPFSGKQKLKLEELAIEQEVLKREVAADKQLTQYKINEKLRQLQLLIKELDFTKKTMNAHLERATIIVEKSNQNAEANPLFSLYQKEESVQKELDFLKLEMMIYQEYIDYLVLTEQLFQTPFYNYLNVN